MIFWSKFSLFTSSWEWRINFKKKKESLEGKSTTEDYSRKSVIQKKKEKETKTIVMIATKN